ncbi:glycosyltransferase family 69 protein [Rhizopogon vinicolor AM-OR11-026]|uniref:Glycosyltransferase family 69 protein n=1 Tax=Rhizopogon vinicolor AM-OR11-026 TaxID=1314800 RepID=A0A1B7N894_9AGAM|nr:glycosyltransferase family 69 protein [Rhizopogon vinicolor AM-OR11-026]
MLQRDSAIARPVELVFDVAEEENALLENAEEGSERHSRPSPPTACLAGPHHKQWWIQLVTYALLFVVSTWIGLHYEQPGDVRYRDSIQSAVAHPLRQGYGKQEKIFVAAMFYNNEQVIPYWHNSLVKVIHYLGPDNVFVSIVESHSTDNSPQLLEALDADLALMGVPRRILIADESVSKPDDMSWNNRIDFLAATRNRALEPLMEGGYDRVVFSNDIYIEPESMVELLETNDGDYDMACGMDFAHFGAYDMWVLRDRQAKLTSAIWPYFFDEADYHAMQTDSPAPVFTCWNGIAVFNADPLLPIALRSNRTLSNDPLPYDLPSTHPAAHDASMRGPSPALTPPIQFRASAPGECYSSESFLLPYDLRRQFNLDRIYVNPRVINGYQWRHYVYFKWFMRHPVLRWWIEKVYNGAWMARAVLVVGDAADVSWWDGGDCHPWWR